MSSSLIPFFFAFFELGEDVRFGFDEIARDSREVPGFGTLLFLPYVHSQNYYGTGYGVNRLYSPDY